MFVLIEGENSAVFVELIYIFLSIWGEYFYYVFGFLLVIMIILVAVSAEIAIVLCYFQLCNGDHRWWWTSFYTPASTGLFVAGYAVFHYFSAMQNMTALSTVMYFGHTLAFSAIIGLVTGTVGLISSFVFVKIIYSLIKAD